MTGTESPSPKENYAPRLASVQTELVDPRIYEETRLRRLGHSYAEIGERFGISPEQVHDDVRQLLERDRMQTSEETEAVRQMELDRLDAAFSVVFEQVLAGDLKAVQPMLKIMDRRAKYLGLDAPVKPEPKGIVTVCFNPEQDEEL